MIGKELAEGDPTPMPLSHYMEVEGKKMHSGEAHRCAPSATCPRPTCRR
jgi:hypothetical protein